MPPPPPSPPERFNALRQRVDAAAPASRGRGPRTRRVVRYVVSPDDRPRSFASDGVHASVVRSLPPFVTRERRARRSRVAVRATTSGGTSAAPSAAVSSAVRGCRHRGGPSRPEPNRTGPNWTELDGIERAGANLRVTLPTAVRDMSVASYETSYGRRRRTERVRYRIPEGQTLPLLRHVDGPPPLQVRLPGTRGRLRLQRHVLVTKADRSRLRWNRREVGGFAG